VDFVYVRYFVDNAERSTRYYQEMLGFEVVMNPNPGFSLLQRGPLRLMLNASGGRGAGQPSSSGAVPEPGGWNRFQIRVDDLDAEIARIAELGGTFLDAVIESMGGRQILLADPDGNMIELFESRDDRRA
jgi:catechol 2,3-dioxygenase-like lactoylglutathione lyase family enzyme